MSETSSQSDAQSYSTPVWPQFLLEGRATLELFRHEWAFNSDLYFAMNEVMARALDQFGCSVASIASLAARLACAAGVEPRKHGISEPSTGALGQFLSKKGVGLFFVIEGARARPPSKGSPELAYFVMQSCLSHMDVSEFSVQEVASKFRPKNLKQGSRQGPLPERFMAMAASDTVHKLIKTEYALHTARLGKRIEMSDKMASVIGFEVVKSLLEKTRILAERDVLSQQ